MKKFNLIITLTILFIYFPYKNSYTQFLWEQLPGLEGANSQVLVINSQGELFVGTYTAGIFKSTDNGVTWVEKNNGLTTANNIISLAINDNDYIFAGTFNTGIFRSTDNGESWTQINNGLTMTNIRSIIFNDSSHVFVCSGGTPFQGGVFRSTNNGDSWTPVFTGLPFGAIFSLGIDSSNNIYAGSGFNGGVYISTNNGENWSPTTLTNVTVMSLTVDKTNNIIYVGTSTDIRKSTDSGQSWSLIGNLGNIWALITNISGDIFAGTWSGSVFRSSDGGNSWVNLKNELTIVQDILITPVNGIFVCTSGPGVFYSSDNGNNWENRSSGIDYLTINSIHITPNGNIFTGSGMIYRSTDNGINWTSVKGGRGNSYYTSIINNNNGDLFAGNGGGSGGYWIYRSTDDGNNWTRINNGLPDSTIWTIALDSLQNLFIGTQAGIFKSSNNGNNWIQMNAGLTQNKIHAIVITDNNTIFAGAGPGGIFRSTDGGDNWERVWSTMANVYSLTINSFGNIFAGVYDGNFGIYKSTDNGDTWTEVNNGLTDLFIRSLASDDSVVYAGTQTGGIFKSDDQGGNWVSINEGFKEINEILSLEVINNYIYAGTKGLWRRPFSGAVPLSPSNLVAIADTFNVTLSWQDNSDNEEGFVIERKDGDSLSVFSFEPIDTVSTNINEYIDTGLEADYTYTYRIYAYNGFGTSSYSNLAQVTTLVPVELTLFTATVIENSVTLNWMTATELNNQGFEIEKQVGNQWEKIGYVPGFGTTTEPKSYSFSDNNITTGTYFYRLKQIDYDGSYEYSNKVEVVVDLTPTEFALYQNYPNPFNPATTIKYGVPVTGNVKLAVYNLIGEEMAVLINGEVEAGIHEVTFKVSSLPSGMYLYKLQSDNLVEVKKMILIK